MKKSIYLAQYTKKEVLPLKKEKYQGMTELIIFLMIEIRSDIMYITLLISCFSKNLSYYHTKVIKIFLKYLKRLKHKRISYSEREDIET